MRKFFLIAMLFLSMKGISQISKGWYAETQLAGGHSWFANNNSQNQFHLHYKGGINLIAKFGNIMGLGFGAAFSSEGNTDGSDFGSSRIIDRSNYLKIPLFARFTFDNKENTAVFVDAGVFRSFLLGGKTKHYYNDKLTDSYPISLFNDSDVGYFFNFGAIQNIGKNSYLSGFIGYNRGIAQMDALIGGNDLPIISNRNINFGILLGKKL
jgi:hypothetical protein